MVCFWWVVCRLIGVCWVLVGWWIWWCWVWCRCCICCILFFLLMWMVWLRCCWCWRWCFFLWGWFLVFLCCRLVLLGEVCWLSFVWFWGFCLCFDVWVCVVLEFWFLCCDVLLKYVFVRLFMWVLWCLVVCCWVCVLGLCFLWLWWLKSVVMYRLSVVYEE